jgi:hypothetical protein
MSTEQSTLFGKTIVINHLGTVIPSQPLRGDMYIDSNTGETRVFDGNAWILITDFVADLPPQGPTVEELCEQHPGLKELQDQLREAQEKFDSYLILVK